MSTTSPTLARALNRLLPPPTILPATNRASVALILRPSSSTPPFDVLLIQRSPRSSDPWSAHIALPGGTKDPSDPDDLSTTVREVREEIGLDLLSPRYTLVARLHDRPIRATTRKQPVLKQAVLSTFIFLQLDLNDPIALQPEEVSSSFWLPLHHLHYHSSLFCTHSIHIPHEGDTTLALLLSALRHIFGLSNLLMPALNVLPHGKDLVKAVEAPHAVLWGMTLDILGDLVENLGMRRVDRPTVLPEGTILAGLLRGLARAQWFIRKVLFWRRPTLDFTVSQEMK